MYLGFQLIVNVKFKKKTFFTFLFLLRFYFQRFPHHSNNKHTTLNSIMAYCEAKTCTVLFLHYLHQIFLYCNNYWHTCSLFQLIWDK